MSARLTDVPSTYFESGGVYTYFESSTSNALADTFLRIMQTSCAESQSRWTCKPNHRWVQFTDGFANIVHVLLNCLFWWIPQRFEDRNWFSNLKFSLWLWIEFTVTWHVRYNLFFLCFEDWIKIDRESNWNDLVWQSNRQINWGFYLFDVFLKLFWKSSFVRLVRLVTRIQ